MLLVKTSTQTYRMAVKMLRLYHKFLLLPISIYLALALTLDTAAWGDSSSYQERESVRAFIHELVEKDRFDQGVLEDIFSQARYRPRIVDAMDRPYKQPPPWNVYAVPILSHARFNQGMSFWNTHRDVLTRAETQFGVPAQIIVAIIGIETFYGQVTGNYRLIDSLSTLAFDYPRRGAFFRDELRQFLLMTRDERLDPLSVRGSFAGAVGMAQFMPSSYRRFGIDFDHDGHTDLWHSADDAIGSVAHFLQEHGWQHQSWEARPIKNLPIDVLERETRERGLSEWRNQEAWQRVVNDPISWSADIKPEDPIALMKLETAADLPYYVWVGPNFQAITKYNRSRLYASAVWSLSCQLAKAQGRTPCPLSFPI